MQVEFADAACHAAAVATHFVRADRSGGPGMRAAGVRAARWTGSDVLSGDDKENGAPPVAARPEDFGAVRLPFAAQSGIRIACESAGVRAASALAGSAGFAAVPHGIERPAFQPCTEAAVHERSQVSFPFAAGGGCGPDEGVISRRAFRGSRQAVRDARAVQ